MTFPPDVPPRWSTRSGADRSGRTARRRLAVIACLVLVAVLTACGSDGDDDSTATTTTVPDETVSGTDDDADDPPVDTAGDPGVTTSEPEQTTTVPDPDPDPDSSPGPGSGPDPDRELTDFENQYVGELTEAMVDMSLPDSVDRGCVSTAWVTAIGGDRIEAAGLSAADFVDLGPGDLDLDRPTAEAMHRGSLDCGLDATALVQSSGADGGDLACLNAAVSDELFEGAMIAAYMGDYDSEVARQLDEVLATCS